jgi:hypothetical protein
VNFLGQNLFFSGRKERFCFAPESISSPQKAPDSILNRRERLQKSITALGQIEEKFFGVSLRDLEREEGKRRRNQKLGVTLILLMIFFLFFIAFICDSFSSMEE